MYSSVLIVWNMNLLFIYFKNMLFPSNTSLKRIGDNAQLSSNKYFPHPDVASKFHFFHTKQHSKKN